MRSINVPHTTDPAAPASTTSAALRPACAGTTPCTRLRKLGSHDHSADTTISCAAPPRHTHSIVRVRASTRTMWPVASPSERRLASIAGSRATVR